MSVYHRIVPFLVLALLAGTGCGTLGGGSELNNAVFDTHRRVTNLDKNLEGSVTKLNENVAGLSAQVDASDQQVKALQSTVEENTMKMKAIEKKIDQLTGLICRTNRLTPPQAGSAPSEVVPDSQRDVETIPPPGRTRGGEAEGRTPGAAPSESTTDSAAPAPSARESATREPAAKESAVPAGANPEADYQQAQRSYAGDNYADAYEQFSAYLQRYPNSDNSSNAQFWKAKSLQNMEKYEDAVTEFEKLRTSYPTSVRVPYAMLYQALCQGKLGQSARASELLKEVVKNYPMTPAADQAKAELNKLRGGGER